MKKAALILAALACFAACKRTVHDSGCISLYAGALYYQYTPTAGQLDTIKSLFGANGISMANLDFDGYYSDTLKDSSGTPIFNQMVYASVSVNGLPVFYINFSWAFHNGVLYPPSSANPQYAWPGSDTTSHQTLPALRSIFFKTYEAALYSNKYIFQSNRLGRPGVYYHESCLGAQLGYIDATDQPNSGLPYGKKLLKVWRLFPQTSTAVGPPYRSPYPTVFVIDSTGAAWCPSPYYPGEPIIVPFSY
jgi:hypothetical protein